MAAFVILMNLTARGLAEAKAAPERIAAGVAALEALGGRMHSFHATMGPYDYVAVGEAPSDEAAATFALALAAQGYVTTTTLRAFSREEFAAMTARLP